MSKSKKRWFLKNKEKWIKSRLKPIIQMDLEDNILGEFSCIKEAVEQTGASETHIRYCCKGVKNQTSGFKFKYKI